MGGDMLLVDVVICMQCIDDKTSVMGGGVGMMWGVLLCFGYYCYFLQEKKKKKKTYWR